jgi:hypothetical protein
MTPAAGLSIVILDLLWADDSATGQSKRAMNDHDFGAQQGAN